MNMEEEKDAFYVVRKGNIIGVYKNFSDCQAQAGSSVSHPSVSVFKGYSFPKEAEEYLTSHGLKNAAYSINAADIQHDLFGKLVPCPVQEPASSKGKTLDKNSPPKRSQEMLLSGERLVMPRCYVIEGPQKKQMKADSFVQTKSNSSGCSSCILAFDGASKGNPGLAGAGAVLRAEDGSLVCRLREGLGITTNNVAEYRAVLLGLKHALKEGYKHIRVQGDSNLVCMQIKGLWKLKNQNMADLCKEARELKDKFVSFEINHVLREYNSEADAQANRAINLMAGQIEEDCGHK